MVLRGANDRKFLLQQTKDDIWIGLENLAYHQDLFVKISGSFDYLINVYDFFPEEV